MLWLFNSRRRGLALCKCVLYCFVSFYYCHTATILLVVYRGYQISYFLYYYIRLLLLSVLNSVCTSWSVLLCNYLLLWNSIPLFSIILSADDTAFGPVTLHSHSTNVPRLSLSPTSQLVDVCTYTEHSDTPVIQWCFETQWEAMSKQGTPLLSPVVVRRW